jgi:myo-inositol-1(or 4)-monophosphatase
MIINADLASVCEDSARAAAGVLLDWKGRFHVREKGPSDLVTEADLAAQEAVRKVVLAAYPGHDVLGEEDSNQLVRRSPYCWIIDPLDGTTNYVHGVPHYAVSVAVAHDDRVLAGVVFDPSADECFRAVLGAGASLNGVAIRSSGTKNLAEGLIAVSFPARVELGSRPMDDFNKVIVRSRAIRRTGSASLNLCYVACGRFDAYFARETKAWDVAAAALIVSEAGGVITGVDGRPFSLARPRFIAAGTANLHAELLALIGDPPGLDR